MVAWWRQHKEAIILAKVDAEAMLETFGGDALAKVDLLLGKERERDGLLPYGRSAQHWLRVKRLIAKRVGASRVAAR